MAKESGLRRVVEFVLDRVSAKQVETTGQDALRKGTDPKKANSNLTSVDRGFDRLKASALKLGGVIASAFALNKIRQFGQDAVRIANESDAIWNRLAGTLRNAGVDFRDVEGDIRATARALQDVSTMGDEDFAAVLTTLTLQTGSYTKSMQRMQLVADLAAGANKSHAEAADLVGKAIAGNTMQLERLFPALRGSKDILGDLSVMMAGMAENELKTNAGLTKALSNEWSDFKEAVGHAMVAAGGGTSVLQTLVGVTKALTFWVERNSEAISGNLRGALMVLIEVGKGAWTVMASIADLFTLVLFASMAGIVSALGWLAHGYALTTRAAAKFADVIGLDGRAEKLREEADAITAQAKAMREWAAAADETARAAGKSLVGRWTPGAAHAQTSASNTPTPGGGGAPPPAGGGTGGGSRSLRGGRAVAPSVSAGGGLSARPVSQLGSSINALEWERFHAFREEFIAGYADMQSVAQTVAAGVSDAWGDAFGLMLEGFDNAGAAAMSLFKGIGGAALGGLAQYASAQMMAEIAEGFKMLGFAKAGLAVPGLVNAPAAAASAKSHFFAAGKFGLLAGAAAGARGFIAGGGGGSAASSSRSSAGLSTAQRTQAPGAEVTLILVGEGFDAINPRVQDVIVGATELAKERYGPNARLRTVRRSRMP